MNMKLSWVGNAIQIKGYVGIKSVSKLTYQEKSWRKTIKEQLFLQNLLLLLVANKGFNLKESRKTSLWFTYLKSHNTIYRESFHIEL